MLIKLKICLIVNKKSMKRKDIPQEINNIKIVSLEIHKGIHLGIEIIMLAIKRVKQNYKKNCYCQVVDWVIEAIEV